MVTERNPKAVEKALMNKSWVAQALLPVPKAEVSHAEHPDASGRHRRLPKSSYVTTM
jgi:hypothetical protein